MNLLVTGAFTCTDEELNALRLLGNEVVFMQYEKSPLPCEAEWVEGIIGNGIFLHHPIESFTSLRFIQLTSAGFDRVPMEYVQSHGIEIFNARGVYSIPMAEFALSGLLQLYKQSRYFMQNQNEHKWEKRRDLNELFGKNICIVGCGSVGTECAKIFSAFSCFVEGVDLFEREERYFERIYPLDQLDTALSNADAVILTLPLTEKTKGLINSDRFKVMKKGAILVNISRGAIVDTSALLNALNGKMLGGAVLDVFEEEPLDGNSPLWNMENVVLTPHNSFVGDGNAKRLWKVIKENLEKCK